MAAAGRLVLSFSTGLWQSTQYSTVLRGPPCSARAAWHLLQASRLTDVRLGATAEPGSTLDDSPFESYALEQRAREAAVEAQLAHLKKQLGERPQPDA